MRTYLLEKSRVVFQVNFLHVTTVKCLNVALSTSVSYVHHLDLKHYHVHVTCVHLSNVITNNMNITQFPLPRPWLKDGITFGFVKQLNYFQEISVCFTTCLQFIHASTAKVAINFTERACSTCVIYVSLHFF